MTDEAHNSWSWFSVMAVMIVCISGCTVLTTAIEKKAYCERVETTHD